MCSGGGYTPPPDRSVELEAMRQAERERERLAEQQRIADEKAAARTRFETATSTAKNAALTNARQAATLRGLTPEDYEDLFLTEADRIATSIPDLDANPGSYYGPDFGNAVLDRKQTGLRTQYGNEVRELFPTNFETNAFADTADDAILDAIIGEQYSNALDSVNRARARGTINDTGFATAQNKLNSAQTTAKSLAQSLGGTVLQRYRGDLRGIKDSAMESASNYNLGSTWDSSPFATQRDSKIADYTGSLEGDIRGAVGGQKFFDIGAILNDAGGTQGATNLGDTSLAGVLASRERTRDSKRGVGGGSQF